MFDKIIFSTFQIYSNVNMYNVLIVHIMNNDNFNVNSTYVGNSALYIILVGISNKINNITGYVLK